MPQLYILSFVNLSPKLLKILKFLPILINVAANLEVTMEFNFEVYNYEEELEELEKVKENYYMILSKSENVKDSDLESVIQIIDENGKRMYCTQQKFVEIFDKKGLSGFI